MSSNPMLITCPIYITVTEVIALYINIYNNCLIISYPHSITVSIAPFSLSNYKRKIPRQRPQQKISAFFRRLWKRPHNEVYTRPAQRATNMDTHLEPEFDIAADPP